MWKEVITRENKTRNFKVMEVHAHTHTESPPAGPAGKKFIHYLWEFLMLFLAVFCGFLAENIREHSLEQNRAREYAKSLIQDFQNDTTSINLQMKSADIYISIADSLLMLSKTRLEGRNAAVFSFYTRFIYWTVPISWNRATFEQIKNSGNLRYFKNYQLLESLMKYEALVNSSETEFSNHQTRGNMLLSQINRIIDPGFHYELSRYLIQSLDTMSVKTREYFFSSPVGSLENKREEIKEMLNMVFVQQRNLRYNDARLRRTKELAIKLILALQKEYHLQ